MSVGHGNTQGPRSPGRPRSVNCLTLKVARLKHRTPHCLQLHLCLHSPETRTSGGRTFGILEGNGFL